MAGLVDGKGYWYIDSYKEFFDDFSNNEFIIRRNIENGQYYAYEDTEGIFVQIDDDLKNKLIVEYCELFDDRAWTPKLGKNILSSFPGYIPNATMNVNKNILVCKNGVLNLKSMKLKSFSYEYYATYRIDIKYDVSATCPTYDRFISEVACGDNELMLTLNELAGYVLVNNINAHKLIAMVGSGANGKSTYLDVISALIDEKRISNIALKEISEKGFSRHELAGKSINLLYEYEKNTTLSSLFSGVVKSLVTGDVISAEIKGGKIYSFRPAVRLIFATNNLPKIDTIPDRAIMRRYLVLPFRGYFGGDKGDPDILKKMLKEKSGILNRALEGLRRLKEQSYHFSYESKSDEYINNMVRQAFPIIKFVEDRIVVNDEAKVKNEELYNAYTSWASEHNVSVISNNKFHSNLKKVLESKNVSYMTDKSNGDRLLKGIGLK